MQSEDKYKQDLDFIKELDGKLHQVIDVYSRAYGNGIHDVYTDKKLSKKDTSKLLKIIEEQDLILRPIKTGYSYFKDRGFEVLQDICPNVFGIPSNERMKSILQFSEKQIKGKIASKEILESCNTPRNKNLINFFKLDFYELNN